MQRAHCDSGIVHPFPRYLLTGAFGAVFAFCLYPLWDLEGRWFIIAIIGIGLVSMSMIFAGRFSNFLFILLLFSVPMAGFAKWSFLDESFYSDPVREAALYTGTLGLGITDFLIAGLYFAWAFRIFVLREEPLPRLKKVDVWVSLLVLAYGFSLWGSQHLRLGVFSLEHLLKHALVYFYVSRHFKREHLPWLMASIAFAIVAEATIGILQYGGALPPGLILDKGAGSELLDKQYRVPGIEDINRATGSLYDSHALGLYLAMLVPYSVVFLYKHALPSHMRLMSFALLVFGLAALVVTYSRSAWLGCAISLGVSALVLIAWRERYVVPSLVGVSVVGVITAPWVFAKIFARLFEAPTELLTARFEQFPVAWSIWRENFLFGSGAGNYMEQMNQHNVDWALAEPVHNVPLFIGAEIGAFGVIAYYGLVVVTLYRLWLLIRRQDENVRRIALAAFAGMLAYVFDGMSNPLFREPTIYMHFWIVVALSVALTREELPLRLGTSS